MSAESEMTHEASSAIASTERSAFGIVVGQSLLDYALALLWGPLVSGENAGACPVLASSPTIGIGALAEDLECSVKSWEALRADLPEAFMPGGALVSELEESLARTIDDGAARRVLIERLVGKTCAGATSGNTFTQADWIVAHNAESAWAAAVLAQRDGRPLMIFDRWEDLGASLKDVDAKTVTVVATLEQLTGEVIASILGQGRPKVASCPVGVLTAATFASLTRMVAKTVGQRTRAVRKNLLVTENGRAFVAPRHEVVPVAELTREAASRLVNEPFDLLAIAAHGDPLDANLNAAVLCGKSPTRNHPRSLLSPTHACQLGDECRRTANRDLLRVPAESMRCGVFFSETCTGIGPADGVFAREVSLSTAVLEGRASAYIATTKISGGSGVGPMLVNALIESGASLGHAVATMSAVHRTSSHDEPSFMLLGDAAARLRPNGQLQRIACDLPENGRQSIELTGRRGLVFAIAVDGEHARTLAKSAGATLEFDVRGARAKDAPAIYGVLLRDVSSSSSPLTVLVFSAGEIAPARIELAIAKGGDSRAALADQLSRLERSASLLRFVQRKASRGEGLRKSPELTKLADDLATALSAADDVALKARDALRVVELAVRPAGGGRKHAPLRARVDEALAAIDLALARGWASWRMTSYTSSFYAGLLFRAGDRAAGACHFCKNPSFETTLECAGRPELTRVMTHCPGCGVLSDRAQGDLLIVIEGPSTVQSGSVLVQQLRIENRSTRAKTYAGALSFEGNLPWLAYTPPAAAQVTVPAGGVAHMSFEVPIGAETKTGVFNLVAFTSQELAINVSVKPVAITELELGK